MKSRLLSLDVFRGLTIFLMIIVNSLNYDNLNYWWIIHAQWNGITFADTVFPTFLFIVGIAINLSSSSSNYLTSIKYISKNLRRTVILMIGLDCSVFACLIYVIDLKCINLGTTFFRVFGVNPLVIYIFSELFLKSLSYVFWGKYDICSMLHNIFIKLFTQVQLASLLFSLSFTLFCWLFAWVLYKYKISLKFKLILF